jgi:RNA polymerase primary sigma factor
MAYPGRHRQKTEILSMLLEKADVQGYLTTEDLMEFYPNGDEDAEHLSAIVVALRRRGVDILDRESDYEEEVEEPLIQNGFEPIIDIERIGSDDTVGLYLKEMSRVPLLSVSEELSLAQRIEKGRMCRKELEKLNGRTLATRRREMDGQIQDGILAREHLIKEYSPGGQHRKKIYRGRRAIPGFNSRGQPWFNEGRREVRLPPRFSFFNVCHLVDPPDDYPLHCRPGPYNSRTSPYD